MKRLIAICLLVVLCGCDGTPAETKSRVLCDTTISQAYLATNGGGMFYLQRAPQMDRFCKPVP